MVSSSAFELCYAVVQMGIWSNANGTNITHLSCPRGPKGWLTWLGEISPQWHKHFGGMGRHEDIEAK